MLTVRLTRKADGVELDVPVVFPNQMEAVAKLAAFIDLSQFSHWQFIRYVSPIKTVPKNSERSRVNDGTYY